MPFWYMTFCFIALMATFYLNIWSLAALESSAALKDEEVNKRFGLESEVIAESTMDVPPVGAILGGVLGQEAIKAIGFKEAPLDNCFIFNGQQMCGNVIKI